MRRQSDDHSDARQAERFTNDEARHVRRARADGDADYQFRLALDRPIPKDAIDAGGARASARGNQTFDRDTSACP